MRFKQERYFIYFIFLFLNFLFANCHAKLDNASESSDLSKTILPAEHQQIIDTSLINQGEVLFNANCSSCHKILKDDNLLEGVVQRVGENYIKLFLNKQDSLIKAKDKHALELERVFRNQNKPHHFDFSGQQQESIIAYLIKNSG